MIFVVWMRLLRTGIPYSLSVSKGCLFASTDRGIIYCFSENKELPPKTSISPSESISTAYIASW